MEESHSRHLAIATQQPDVPVYTNCDIQLQNVTPDDGLIQSETCRALNDKLRHIIRISASSCSTYIHIAIRCTVYTASNLPQGRLSSVSKHLYYLPQYTGWFRTKRGVSTGHCDRKVRLNMRGIMNGYRVTAVWTYRHKVLSQLFELTVIKVLSQLFEPTVIKVLLQLFEPTLIKVLLQLFEPSVIEV